MKILYEKSFLRDIKQITDRKILDKIEQTIFDIKKAKHPDQIRKLRKIRGYKSYYRLKLGDYRLGVKIEENVVTFLRFKHRRDIYRVFP